ncbi:MAG TPA: Mut7-C RNAse domain-containing protein [Acidobacteriota bacterium]|jgi:hypothetical protein
MENLTTRFAADVMLGRLARWLRAAGLDVSYDNSFSDDQLVQIFLREKRWIITRDRGLVKRRILQRAVLLETDLIEDQLQEFFVKTRFVLDSHSLQPFSRCIECNLLLDSVPAHSVQAEVPPYVFATQQKFKRCSACHKIYWAGTHRAKIQAMLERAQL